MKRARAIAEHIVSGLAFNGVDFSGHRIMAEREVEGCIQKLLDENKKPAKKKRKK